MTPYNTDIRANGSPRSGPRPLPVRKLTLVQLFRIVRSDAVAAVAPPPGGFRAKSRCHIASNSNRYGCSGLQQ